jgi:hypothetical protein
VCSVEATTGTEATLVATPAAGSTFAGWSGACSGTGPCNVTLSQSEAVTAAFTATSPPIQTPTSPPTSTLTPPPSNKFSTLSRSVGGGGTVTLALGTTDAGSFTARAAFVETLEVVSGRGKHQHRRAVHRQVSYGDASGHASGAGATLLRLSPTAKALARLRALHTLHVTIVVTFMPTGGSANQTTEHATVTAPTRGSLRRGQQPKSLLLGIRVADDSLGGSDVWLCGPQSSPEASRLAHPRR